MGGNLGDRTNCSFLFEVDLHLKQKEILGGKTGG
jgi:hypothetical protein